MQRTVIITVIALLIVFSLIGAAMYVAWQAKVSARMSDTQTELEAIMTRGEMMTVRPQPGHQIQVLMTHDTGRKLLGDLDQKHKRLAVDLPSGNYICVWNGPEGKQFLFSGPVFNLTSGLPTQVTITEAQLSNDAVLLVGTATTEPEDEDTLRKTFGLEPGKSYEVRIKLADLANTDMILVWRDGTLQDDDEGDEPDAVAERADRTKVE